MMTFSCEVFLWERGISLCACEQLQCCCWWKCCSSCFPLLTESPGQVADDAKVRSFCSFQSVRGQNDPFFTSPPCPLGRQTPERPEEKQTVHDRLAPPTPFTT